MYLNQITFPDRESEGSFFAGIMRTVVKERLFSNRF